MTTCQSAMTSLHRVSGHRYLDKATGKIYQKQRHRYLDKATGKIYQSSVQDIMKVDAASSTRKARQASLAWAELTRQRFIGVLDAGMPASHIPRGFIDRNLRAKTDDLDRRCNKT